MKSTPQTFSMSQHFLPLLKEKSAAIAIEEVSSPAPSVLHLSISDTGTLRERFCELVSIIQAMHPCKEIIIFNHSTQQEIHTIPVSEFLESPEYKKFLAKKSLAKPRKK